MKKNLLSILILALLVVNIVISVIMMISVSSASKKTASLVADIATIIDLDIDGLEKTSVGKVSMSDTVPYNIDKEMTISLKKGEDGKDHYAIVKIALSMNAQNEDYNTYKDTMADREGLITSIVFDVVGARTAEEASSDKAGMREEILTKVQELFGSDFIYDVAFSEILIQ